MRKSLPLLRVWRRALVVAAIAGPIALASNPVSAEGLFDFFFGGAKQHRPAAAQTSFFADPFNNNPHPVAQPRASSGPAFCVRTCDGRYFPLMRASASPVPA